MDNEFIDWINTLVCNVDECCDRCCGESLSNSQFLNIEDSLQNDLKDIWIKAQKYDTLMSQANICDRDLENLATVCCEIPSYMFPNIKEKTYVTFTPDKILENYEFE